MFDVEGAHSGLNANILLRRSAVSPDEYAKYMNDDKLKVDSGPCWLLSSLWDNIFHTSGPRRKI